MHLSQTGLDHNNVPSAGMNRALILPKEIKLFYRVLPLLWLLEAWLGLPWAGLDGLWAVHDGLHQGWQVVLHKSLVPNGCHKLPQKWHKNLVSLSLIMVLGTPCSLMISLRYGLAIWDASSALWDATKWAILVNLSTTTMTESLLLCILGEAIIKSMLTSSQGLNRIGRGV